MRVADFDFELPEAQIAQHPPVQRGESRLLVLDRRSGGITHTTFGRLPDFLAAGDRLVLNDTRVFPARLLGTRLPGGGAVECLLVQPLHTASESSVEWEALMHPGQRLKPGGRVRFGDGALCLEGEVLERHYHGRRTVRLTAAHGSVMSVIERIGHIPLPPYIKRTDTPDDRERYQTVYARESGSIAAPTAGLHFTPGLLETIRQRGVHPVSVTLHVGYGTFKPVRVEDVEEHRVEAEAFRVSPAAAAELTAARREGRRVIAVGTTTTRVLESLQTDGEGVRDASGSTDLFVRPGHTFTLVDGLVTNFHLPRSSLLMLVAALGGREQVLAAYREAVREGYRFYSYGDAMLVL